MGTLRSAQWHICKRLSSSAKQAAKLLKLGASSWLMLVQEDKDQETHRMCASMAEAEGPEAQAQKYEG